MFHIVTPKLFLFSLLTNVVAVHFDAGSSGEQPVPVLAATHTRHLVNALRVIVVERVIARRIVPIH